MLADIVQTKHYTTRWNICYFQHLTGQVKLKKKIYFVINTFINCTYYLIHYFVCNLFCT
jgi:hypothetical protein